MDLLSFSKRFIYQLVYRFIMNLVSKAEQILYKEIIFIVNKKKDLERHYKEDPAMLWQNKLLLQALDDNLKLVESSNLEKSNYLSEEYKKAYKDLHGFLVLKNVKNIDHWYEEAMPKINQVLHILAIEFLIAKIHEILIMHKDRNKRTNLLTYTNVFHVIELSIKLTRNFIGNILSLPSRKDSPQEKELIDAIQDALRMFRKDPYIQEIEDYKSIPLLALKKYEEMNNSYFASFKQEGKSITDGAAWTLRMMWD